MLLSNIDARPALPAGSDTRTRVAAVATLVLPPLDRGAVRRGLVHALRNLHRRDELARNVLAGTRLVERFAPETRDSPAGRLRAAIVSAVEELRRSPCDRYAATLLDAAFIATPRRKQLAVACELALGFSTYRRHLAAAITTLADLFAGAAECD